MATIKNVLLLAIYGALTGLVIVFCISGLYSIWIYIANVGVAATLTNPMSIVIIPNRFFVWSSIALLTYGQDWIDLAII